MLKAILFLLLCGLGYRLVRAVGERHRRPQVSRPDGGDAARIVEAEFEVLDDDEQRAS